jgi:predicted NAD-dependent protein-ADP-ribosyltransferase YbiA (DUF1768 family)
MQQKLERWYMGGKRKNLDGAIQYYSKSSDGYEVLSNFYYAPFEIDDVRFTSVEDYFHWYKSHNAFFVNRPLVDGDKKKHGLAALKKSKEFGTILGWHSRELYGDGIALRVMEEGMMAKFSQNPELKDFLLQTGDNDLMHFAKFLYTAILENESKQGKGYGNFYWGCMMPADKSKSVKDVFLAAYQKEADKPSKLRNRDAILALGEKLWNDIESKGFIHHGKWIGMNRTGQALMRVRSRLQSITY